MSPGLPLLVSDGVNSGYLICVEASRIAGNGGEVELSEITDATMQLEDALTVDAPRERSFDVMIVRSVLFLVHV